MKRRGWVVAWGWALAACLSSGCLFYRGVAPEGLLTGEQVIAGPLDSAAAPKGAPAAGPKAGEREERPGLSNYQVQPRISASGPPVPPEPGLERVKLEVKPAERPATASGNAEDRGKGAKPPAPEPPAA